WLAYACDYIADYYDSGEGIQWGDTVSGQSLEDYAKDQALQNAALYATVETWAEDYGCTLTDEDRTAMDREWAARAAQYGGEEAYLAVLARMGLDRAEAEAISGDYY
ncbi:phage holin, LLH family, partial [Dysosmobacter welbionis]